MLVELYRRGQLSHGWPEAEHAYPGTTDAGAPNDIIAEDLVTRELSRQVSGAKVTQPMIVVSDTKRHGTTFSSALVPDVLLGASAAWSLAVLMEVEPGGAGCREMGGQRQQMWLVIYARLFDAAVARSWESAITVRIKWSICLTSACRCAAPVGASLVVTGTLGVLSRDERNTELPPRQLLLHELPRTSRPSAVSTQTRRESTFSRQTNRFMKMEGLTCRNPRLLRASLLKAECGWRVHPPEFDLRFRCRGVLRWIGDWFPTT